jgi:hypothetical protein
MGINKNVKWRLMQNGDIFEMSYWPFFKDTFPNYEVFWSLYIVPLTGRVSDPKSIQFREKIAPLIEEICMTHYTIFRSLCFIYDEKKQPKNESLRNVYYHFGLIIEMVETLIKKIYHLKANVGLISEEKLEPLKEDEIISRVKTYVNKDYQKQHDEFINEGRPVIFYIHSPRDLLKAIVKDDNLLNKAKEYFNEIKNYRNAFIHTPLPGTLFTIDPLNKNQIRFAIKKDHIKKYKLWTDITHTFSINIDDFIVEEQLLETDFYKTQEILNEIWDFLIKEMNGIKNQPKYKELAKL